MLRHEAGASRRGKWFTALAPRHVATWRAMSLHPLSLSYSIQNTYPVLQTLSAPKAPTCTIHHLSTPSPTVILDSIEDPSERLPSLRQLLEKSSLTPNQVRVSPGSNTASRFDPRPFATWRAMSLHL